MIKLFNFYDDTTMLNGLRILDTKKNRDHVFTLCGTKQSKVSCGDYTEMKTFPRNVAFILAGLGYKVRRTTWHKNAWFYLNKDGEVVDNGKGIGPSDSNVFSDWKNNSWELCNEPTHTITIDGRSIELSEEGFNALKESLK